MIDTTNYKIHSSTREELSEGWIWIRNYKNEGIMNELEGRRRIIRIRNKNNCIFCEALYINDLDLEWFQGRFNIKPEDKMVFISQWYLCKLGYKNNPNFADLELEINSNIFWQLFACLQHPQISIFISTILGMISVGLGFIGFGLGLISISRWDLYNLNIVACVGVIIGIIGMVIICYSSIQFILRSMYTPKFANN
jgi:hypothetical protein